MKIRSFLSIVILVIAGSATFSQSGQPSDKEFDTANELFVKANVQLKNKEYAAALVNFEAALKILPNESSILYNAGLCALLAGANDKAIPMLSRLKALEPDDWQTRAKLIQAYQGVNKIAERDKERDDLLALRKGGTNKELNEQREFCRERFQAGGRNVMGFEYFEFKGPRGIRYVFYVLNAEDKEDYRISLGSYDMTNAIWQETTEPKPKKGTRLFHLDGYFRNGGHATYGMYPGEPTYEETRKLVVEILEKNKKPISATIPAQEPTKNP